MLCFWGKTFSGVFWYISFILVIIILLPCIYWINRKIGFELIPVTWLVSILFKPDETPIGGGGTLFKEY